MSGSGSASVTEVRMNIGFPKGVKKMFRKTNVHDLTDGRVYGVIGKKHLPQDLVCAYRTKNESALLSGAVPYEYVLAQGVLPLQNNGDRQVFDKPHAVKEVFNFQKTKVDGVVDVYIVPIGIGSKAGAKNRGSKVVVLQQYRALAKGGKCIENHINLLSSDKAKELLEGMAEDEIAKLSVKMDSVLYNKGHRSLINKLWDAGSGLRLPFVRNKESHNLENFLKLMEESHTTTVDGKEVKSAVVNVGTGGNIAQYKVGDTGKPRISGEFKKAKNNSKFYLNNASLKVVNGAGEDIEVGVEATLVRGCFDKQAQVKNLSKDERKSIKQMKNAFGIVEVGFFKRMAIAFSRRFSKGKSLEEYKKGVVSKAKKDVKHNLGDSVMQRDMLHLLLANKDIEKKATEEDFRDVSEMHKNAVDFAASDNEDLRTEKEKGLETVKGSPSQLSASYQGEQSLQEHSPPSTPSQLSASQERPQFSQEHSPPSTPSQLSASQERPQFSQEHSPPSTPSQLSASQERPQFSQEHSPPSTPSQLSASQERPQFSQEHSPPSTPSQLSASQEKSSLQRSAPQSIPGRSSVEDVFYTPNGSGPSWTFDEDESPANTPPPHTPPFVNSPKVVSKV